MKNFVHSTTVTGVVENRDENTLCFTLRTRSGDLFTIHVRESSRFAALTNLDAVDRDRVEMEGEDKGSALSRFRTFVQSDFLLTVQGVNQQEGENSQIEAEIINFFTNSSGGYLFEETHWWLTQISRMADQWLDSLFQDRRTYQLDDFAELYRTNLNILGLPTEDNIQEMATLSRLIYGLSSAYLLTGRKRYYLAARAGMQYHRETFRVLSHDGQYCFWAYGKRKERYGSRLVQASLNGDDYGTIPLYEQIYALAGLAQYYRITADWQVYEDIKRTVRAFNDFYLDSKDKNPAFPGNGGYFSHLDYATMRPDVPALDRLSGQGNPNRSRKNWNSIGDHIPAYLVNIILALDVPPPADGLAPATAAEDPDEQLNPDFQDAPGAMSKTTRDDIGVFATMCSEMVEDLAVMIVEKFPDADPSIPYVNERFLADWTPDHEWGWQQNRAVVGHNLKISWNLVRVANYLRGQQRPEVADRLMVLAHRLAKDMAKVGIDQTRGGCYDAVERVPKNGMSIDFAWGSTKDFWQQEQAILAYLILSGATDDPVEKAEYLQLARECIAFWNLFFLDHDRGGIFFRTTDDGEPVSRSSYADKGGHAIAGYHSFELNYLAHIYIRTFVARPGEDREFCLYFRPSHYTTHRAINVLPDFLPPGSVAIKEVTVGGVQRTPPAQAGDYSVEIAPDDRGAPLKVIFQVVGD